MAPRLQISADLSPEATERARYWLSTPNRFIEGYLRANLWTKQRMIVDSCFNNTRTAVKSCVASGKTYVAACVGLAFMARYTDCVVVTTAPTWGQVEKLLWARVHQVINQSVYPWPKALTTELKMAANRVMYGISTRVEQGDEGVKFQGIHAENVLFVLDEAPGVDPALQGAAEGALSSGNAHMLEIGNPTVPTGPFADHFSKDLQLWKTFTISAFDTPNLAGLNISDLYEMEKNNPEELARNPIPYLINRRFVLDMHKKHGSNGMFYKSRVEGHFPDQSSDSLFPLSRLEAQRELTGRAPGGKLRGGLDVAGPGENETVLVLMDGPDIVFHHGWSEPDPRGQVAAVLMPLLREERLANVNVDTIGIGYGMYLHLNDLNIPCTSINVGLPANDTEKFENVKAELYWGLADRSKEGDLGGLDDDLISELSAIRYEQTPRGKVKIESKEDLMKRGVQSPDHAEALMLCQAGGLDIWEKL